MWVTKKRKKEVSANSALQSEEIRALRATFEFFAYELVI